MTKAHVIKLYPTKKLKIDRDLNASKNFANYGTTLKYRESKACGEGSSASAMVHSPSEKQEVKNNY
jgi:transposase